MPRFTSCPAVKRRYAVLPIIVAIVALVATGCSGFIAAPTASQQNVIGSVAVSSQICLDGFGENEFIYTFTTSCSPPAGIPTTVDTNGTATVPLSAGAQGQVLVAYVVPNGTVAPATLTSTGGEHTTFARSSAYATQLTTMTTPPTGYHWVGYMSSEFTVSEAVGIDLTADFTPPAGSGGTPSAGPFTVQEVVVGDRADGQYNGYTLAASRALECNEVADDADNDNTSPTGCTNGEETTALTINTRELTVAAPSGSTNAQAGKSVTIPFTIGYAGAHASFALSGTSDAHGAKLTPQDAKLSLTATGGATTTPEQLTVALPRTVAGGKHHVSLHVQASGTACKDASACTRSATATIIVKGLRPTIANVKLAKPKLALAFKLNVASKLRLTLEGKHGHHWSKLHSITKSAGEGTRHLRLKQLFRKQLANPGNYRVTIQASNHTLKSKPRTVTFATG